MIKVILISLILVSALFSNPYDRAEPMEMSPTANGDIIPFGNNGTCPGNSIISTGISDMSKGLYIAKKRATMDAYRDAVSRGSGVKIESFTQARTSNAMSNVYDVIQKKAKGFIHSYEVIGANEPRKNRYEITIRACVIQNPSNDFSFENGLKMFVEMLGSPKILFVLNQKHYAEAKSQSRNNIGIKSNSTNLNVNITSSSEMLNDESFEIRTVETIMAEYFKKYNYDVMTSDDLINRGIADESRIKLARKGRGGDAIQLARDAGVDLVVTGSITYNLTKNSIGDAVVDMATVSLNGKVIMPGSGKTVGVYNKTDRVLDLMGDAMTARESAIRKGSEKISANFVWDIPKYLLNEEREIEINFNNVSYNGLRKIKKLLKAQKEVLDIQDNGRWKKTSGKKGSSHISLQTSYLGVTVDDILDHLENNGYSPNVEEATPYFIRLSF